MSTNTDTPSQGIGLSEAASQFEALLSGNAGKQTPERQAADESPADDQAEALEASTEDETPTEEEGAEEAEAAADDEEADEASDTMDQLVTVKIDGKEEQIPLKEAIAGYQRQADYSRKTAHVAEMRKQIEAEAQQVMAERAVCSPPQRAPGTARSDCSGGAGLGEALRGGPARVCTAEGCLARSQ